MAEYIIDYYKYLIGKPFASGIAEMEIINLVVAPVNERQFSLFMDAMSRTMNYSEALSVSGYDAEAVVVLIMASHKFAGDIRINQNFDLYLRKNHMERVYLNPYYFNE